MMMVAIRRQNQVKQAPEMDSLALTYPTGSCMVRVWPATSVVLHFYVFVHMNTQRAACIYTVRYNFQKK